MAKKAGLERQILREVNFGESRSSKTAGAIKGAMNCVNLVCFRLRKVQQFLQITI